MWVAASGVHRMGRSVDWRAKALVQTAGGALTGAAAGALVGWIGGVIQSPERAAISTVAAMSIAALPLLRVPLPQRDRETPQALLHRGPIAWSLGNGALLGLAVTSRIGFWLWYAVPLAAFASGSVMTGCMVWGTYGFVRLALVAAVAANMRAAGDGGVHGITARLIESKARLRPAMTALAVVVGAATAVWSGV